MVYAATVIYVHDITEAMDFYTRVFGFKVHFIDLDVQFPGRTPGGSYQFGELAIDGATIQFATPALGALLMPGFPEQQFTKGLELAFYTDEVETVYEQALSAGAAGLRIPTAMPWGQKVSYVRSPHDVYIAICEPPKSPE